MQPEDDPDVQCMLAVQAGDTAAFQTLYRKYARQVARYAMQFVGSQARAEELAQDVFLLAFRARRSYKPRARFATWLFRIATNTCLSEVRRPEHRGQMRSLEAAEPGDERGAPVQLADPRQPDAEASTLGIELQDRIRHLLENLPAQQRAAVVLARAEGFSYEEVARSLGCSVSAVKSLIHRATVALRDALRDDFPQGRS